MAGGRSRTVTASISGFSQTTEDVHIGGTIADDSDRQLLLALLRLLPTIVATGVQMEPVETDRFAGLDGRRQAALPHGAACDRRDRVRVMPAASAPRPAETAADEVSVAVVIPVYKQPGFLAEVISSVLSQRAPFAIGTIIVDDGCPFDETRAVALTFARSHPGSVCYVRRENGGLFRRAQYRHRMGAAGVAESPGRVSAGCR